MADWKRVLRQIKKTLSGAADGQNSRNPGAKQLAQPTFESETSLQKTKPVIVTVPTGTAQHVTVPLAASTRQLALSMQCAVVPASASSTPGPVVETLSRPKGIPTTFHATPRIALTRQAYFKIPDQWVAAGVRTQLSSGNDSAAVDIVIGLDFGTSYTKAAIGMRDQILPVSWEGISAVPDRYLLPTEYSVLSNGSCQLGQAPSGSYERVCQRLKHPFIDTAVSSAKVDPEVKTRMKSV